MLYRNHTTQRLMGRRLLSLCLAALTLAAIVLIPGPAPVAQAAEKTVTIPDPSGYFGTCVSKTEYKTMTVYNYSTGSDSDATEKKIKSFVDALDDLGLKQTKHSYTAYGSSVNGERFEITRSSEKAVDIYWKYDDKSIVLQVFTGVTVGGKTDTATTTTNKQLTIPSPADYFGSIDYTSEARTAIIYECKGFSSYPKSKVNSYIKALKAAGLTGGKVEKQNNGDMLVKLYYNDERAISIRWYKKDKYVWFNISNIVSVEGAAASETTKPTTTIKPATTTTTTTASKDGYLPDPTKFLGVRMYDNRAHHEDAWHYSVTFQSDDGSKKALREYVELLQSPEYNLELIDYQVIDYTLIEKGHTYQLSFRYKGSKDIDTFKDYNDQMSHVCLVVNFTKDAWGLGPSLYVSLDYKDKLIDSGKRASERVVCNLSGRNEYDDDPGQLDVLTDCGTCGGRKVCQDCGGKGEKRHSVIGQPGEYTTETCRTCSGLKKCPTCHGTGHR